MVKNAKLLGLNGSEQLSIVGIDDHLKPGQLLTVYAKRDDGSVSEFQVLCRIDTGNELDYYKNGGILHFVLRQMLRA